MLWVEQPESELCEKLTFGIPGSAMIDLCGLQDEKPLGPTLHRENNPQ